MWEDRPPPSVAASIQVGVSALRALLLHDGANGARPVIETTPPGYRLAVDESSCDVDRFRRLRARGRAEHLAGRPDPAAELYQEALAQWSGPAYDGLQDKRFAVELAVQLDEERLATIEARAEIDLARGRHRDLVGDLTALVAENPFRESLWLLHMTALFRSGRQADALAAYRSLRTNLGDELGLEPGTAARRLESAMLAQDGSLDWTPLPSGQSPPPPPPAVDAVTLRESGDAPSAWLREETGRRIPLGDNELRIGRLPDNTLVIDDAKVSRHHANITAAASQHVVTDLGSTNGTRVNGVLVVGGRTLEAGDSIEIGGTRFEFVTRPASD